ncbi:hypothetical protein LZ30DRAFT_717767 [Colletotrichum cereale]|nr:hypothetical protein LZ30DRAFT_717767 [Colletotrichum cereale]
MIRLVVTPTMVAAAAAVATAVAKDMVARQLRPLLQVLPLGINLPGRRTAMLPTVATPGTAPRPAWRHLRACPLPRRALLVSELLRAWLVVSMHSSSNTRAVRPRRLPRTTPLLLLPATSLPHLLPLVPDLDFKTWADGPRTNVDFEDMLLPEQVED